MRIFLLLLTLCACCPAPTTGTPNATETAFRAQILSVNADSLRVRSPSGDLTIYGQTVRDPQGRPLELTQLRPGESVYVRGTLEPSGVRALELRRLN